MNPRGTPQRIRRGQLPDQRAHVRRYAWAPGAVSAFPGPEQAKTAAMPRDDRLRLDDMNGRAPAAPCMREPRPKDSIGRREAKTRPPRSIDDGQLVSERDDFQVQRGARLDEKSERVEQRNDDRGHDCRLSENARNLNRRNTYGVLSNHRCSRSSAACRARRRDNNRELGSRLRPQTCRFTCGRARTTKSRSSYE
jgi:hypothetical protein